MIRERTLHNPKIGRRGGWTSSVAFLLIAFISGCAELPEGVEGSNSLPVAEIIAPAPEPGGNSDKAPVRYRKGEQVLFHGYGLDTEEDTLEGNSVTWTSNRDGIIGSGRRFFRSELSNGAHRITLTVIDRNGATGRDSVRVVIRGGKNDHQQDDGLVVEIQSRAKGLHFFEGDEIILQGTATDNRRNELTGSSLKWSSDRDGEVGLGEQIDLTDRLSLGNHKITLTATDSAGNSSSDWIRLTLTRAVGPDNGELDVEILLPRRAHHFFEDEEFILKGTAGDEEIEETADSLLQWSSDLDGVLGTGSELDVTGSLSIGNHIITLTAADSTEVFGSDSRRIIITRARGGGRN